MVFFRSLLGAVMFFLFGGFSVSSADEVLPARLETLKGTPVVKGYLLGCIIDNDGTVPITVQRVEFYYSCRFPQNRFHFRYRCEEAGVPCVIEPDDYAEFDGPLLSNCYLVNPVCLVRYKADPS